MPLSHTSTYAELTDVQLKLLGRISAEWSNVEFLLTVLLSRLLLTPEFLARTYTSNVSTYRVISAIREALEIHEHRYRSKIVGASEAAKIVSLLNDVDRMRVTRNRVSHFCWTRQTDDKIFGTSFAGGVPNAKREKRDSAVLSNTELEQVGTDCHNLVTNLLETTKLLPEIEEEEALRLAVARDG